MITYKDSLSLFDRNFWNLLCCVIIIDSQTRRSPAIELSVLALRSDKLKMSLDKSRIPKRGNSSRKFTPKQQRRALNDPFVKRIKRTRTDTGETVSGRMVETRSQKSSEERKAMLEVEVHPDQATNENQEIHGPEGRDRRLASESTPVEQGQDFATSRGTLDREEMSELSDISTEIVATRRSPTDNTMMAGVTEKQTTSSSFSERMKNTCGNIFPFTKVNPRRKKRTKTSKLTLDLESASIVRPRRMRHTSKERLEPRKNLVW